MAAEWIINLLVLNAIAPSTKFLKNILKKNKKGKTFWFIFFFASSSSTHHIFLGSVKILKKEVY